MDKQAFLAVAVPELNVDKGEVLTPARRMERRVVAAMLAHLAAHGFVPKHIWDGEEKNPVESVGEAMEWVFNLDESVLYVKQRDTKRGYGITLIPGNAWHEIINDHADPDEDPYGFVPLMDTFCNLMTELSDDATLFNPA